MELFPYQRAGIDTLKSKTRFILRDEPGLGKTCQLIVASKELGAQNVLVLCPKSMVLTWEKEIKMWGADPSKYTVINHDKLIGKKSIQYFKNWDIVICDESHQCIKNISTLRAKAFLQLIENSKVVWLATATVASRSGEDYYCTLKVLLPLMMNKISKSRFVSRFCRKVKDPWSYSGFKYEGFNNMEELHTIFSKCSLKRTEKSVALELPELRETEMEVEDKYPSFTIEEIEDIKKRVKDGVSLGEGYQGKLKLSGLNKIPSVIELLNTYPKDKSVVIFAWHKDVITKMMEEAGKVEGRSCSYIDGSINSSEERQKRIDDFQEGRINTLVLNMQSGGSGITLTRATVGVYIQFPHSVIHWVQSRKRIHRIGSKKPVQLIKLFAKGSIDEEIFSVLSSRAEYIKEVEE